MLLSENSFMQMRKEKKKLNGSSPSKWLLKQMVLRNVYVQQYNFIVRKKLNKICDTIFSVHTKLD